MSVAAGDEIRGTAGQSEALRVVAEKKVEKEEGLCRHLRLHMDSFSCNSGFEFLGLRILRPLQLNDDSVSQWVTKDVVITLLVARTPYALIYTRRESMMPEGGREEERYCIFTLLCRDL